MKTEEQGRAFAPTRVMEMLEWRFGAFEALAYATVGAIEFDPDMCPPMDTRTAWAILEFADDLKQASGAADAWMEHERHEIKVLKAAVRRFNEQRRDEEVNWPSGEPADESAGSGEGMAEIDPASVPAAEEESGESSEPESLATGDAAPTMDPPAPPALHQNSYEQEGSEQRSAGSVSVARGAWWSAELSVPIRGGDGAVFLHFERYGESPTGYRGDEEASFFLPAVEVDAVITLLQGVVAQARRDGVLSEPSIEAPDAGEEIEARDD